MNSPKHQNQYGVTLLETMLALAIAVSLVVFGLRVFDQFSFQAKEQKIAANVNQLFQALKGYYDANCRQSLDTNSTAQSSGRLDPLVSDTPSIPPFLTRSIATDLVTPGFLTSWQPINALVDNSATDNGYFVQYNRVLSGSIDPVMSVYACTGSSNSPSCNAMNGSVLATSMSQPTNQSRVIIWVAQVAVKLSDSLTPAQWIQIKNDLNADCVSTSASKADCTTTPSGSGYLIWQRMPSAYNPNITSDYWTSTPYVKQFNMQYTNDGVAALSGVKDETKDSGTSKTWYNPLNYLCGG